MTSTDVDAGLAPLLELEAELGAIVSAGATPGGEVRLVPILSGSFRGTDVSGRVLPGGADWQQIRSDGTLEIRAHYLLETDQGERIEVRSEGLRSGSAEVLARLARGEILPKEQYYFRTAMRFATASRRLWHLNDLLAIARGERKPTSVLLSVYRVL
jgi:hypothetical protein